MAANGNGSQVVNFLLVEDDDIAAEVVARALKSRRIANPLIVARDGVEAFEIIEREHAKGPFSCVIFLDLHLPRMDGLEFLKRLRSHPTMSGCQVFVLTTSNADADKLRAHDVAVAGFFSKGNLAAEFDRLTTLPGIQWQAVVPAP